MKVYILNAIQSGLDVFEHLRDRIPIAGYIGLSERWNTDKVSGFVHAREICQRHELPYLEVESYSLKEQADKDLLCSLGIDVLIVAGWQRLIPAWLIDHVNQCCVGAHGSPLGITRGRGRSPQNWAMILGLTNFDISIFKITPGVDSGAVIASRSFTLEPADDIRTSYIKVSYHVSHMIVEAFERDMFRLPGTPQDEDQAEYLPQRVASDGQIDWHRRPHEIANFVRGQTRPYPGAFSSVSDHRVTIWNVVPFSINEADSSHSPGEIIQQFCEGELLVGCLGGAVIVKDFDSDFQPENWRGYTLESASYAEQIETILQRHHEKLPAQPVSSLLTEAGEDEG